MKDSSAVTAAIRRLYASAEPNATQRPSFRATLQAASHRGTHQSPRRLGWNVAMIGGIGAAALAILLVLWSREPTLQDDIQLASTVSYDDIWRSPSDHLLVQAVDPLLGSTPTMPLTGTPNLSLDSAKEYL